MRNARGFLAGCAVLAIGCAPRPIIDRQAVFDRYEWWDNRDWDWYRAKIPFLETPDPDIDETYYYRWEVLTKHLVYGSPETGYTFTEFIDRPFWSGAYGAISCPLGHQHYEVRWLKDRRIIEDFARYWFETTGAQPRSYSNWYGDAMWATYLVLGDTGFARTVLPHMETQYQGWVDERWDAGHRMFRWDGMHDGMETNINSRQTADEFMGAEGYRPTLNSYLFADARAISNTARVLGDETKAQVYAERAAALRQRVQEELWDPERSFFFHQFADDELHGITAGSLTYEQGSYAGSPHGRELIGYVPWQFNLPDPGYESAWQFLMDPEFFAAPFGPTTVEQNDPLFFVSPRCCIWSGNAWPYATTQTLVAFANLLNNYEQSIVNAEDYVSLLRTYSRSHRRDGRPYVAEAADPDDGSWDGHNTFYHSEHYFHSGYVDLIITGLIGLRPRDDGLLEINPLVPDDWEYFALEDVAYQGHSISIVWDERGTRYDVGPGLTILVDGESVAHRPTIGRLTTPLAARAVEPVVRRHNLAVNNGAGHYPLILDSYSAPGTSPHVVVDGNYWYHQTPPNRWTSAGSGTDEDWLTVEFGVKRRVGEVRLYFLDDSAGAGPPARYAIEMRDGAGWTRVPGQRRTPVDPTGRRANTVEFMTIETEAIRVVFTHRVGLPTGLTEFEVWGPGELPLPPPVAPRRNVALAPGASVSASFTADGDDVSEVNDALIEYTRYSGNRWTARGSPNARDWIEVTLDVPRTVSAVDVHLVADLDRGLVAPDSLIVQTWDGLGWVDVIVTSRVPEKPMGSTRNRVTFSPVETTRVRAVMVHALPGRTAVTEMAVWRHSS